MPTPRRGGLIQALGDTIGASMRHVAYLAALSAEARARHSLDEIRAAIAANGFWERHDEWRIFTVTTKRIEAAEQNGRSGFLVHVSCDQEFSCHCPTIERAVEFLGVYDGLIIDMFGALGWPSWVSRERLDP
jgi:hypothetical protein